MAYKERSTAGTSRRVAQRMRPPKVACGSMLNGLRARQSLSPRQSVATARRNRGTVRSQASQRFAAAGRHAKTIADVVHAAGTAHGGDLGLGGQLVQLRAASRGHRGLVLLKTCQCVLATRRHIGAECLAVRAARDANAVAVRPGRLLRRSRASHASDDNQHERRA